MDTTEIHNVTIVNMVVTKALTIQTKQIAKTTTTAKLVHKFHSLLNLILFNATPQMVVIAQTTTTQPAQQVTAAAQHLTDCAKNLRLVISQLEIIPAKLNAKAPTLANYVRHPQTTV